MTKTCPKCAKGGLIRVDNIVSEIEGYVFIEKGYRCSHCNEEYVDEKESQRTIGVPFSVFIGSKSIEVSM